MHLYWSLNRNKRLRSSKWYRAYLKAGVTQCKVTGAFAIRKTCLSFLSICVFRLYWFFDSTELTTWFIFLTGSWKWFLPLLRFHLLLSFVVHALKLLGLWINVFFTWGYLFVFQFQLKVLWAKTRGAFVWDFVSAEFLATETSKPFVSILRFLWVGCWLFLNHYFVIFLDHLIF